jgi:hypothetical protein
VNISDFYAHFRNKNDLCEMLGRFGEENTAKRLAWLHECDLASVKTLIHQLLTDDYVDDKGIKGGNFFWGDL